METKFEEHRYLLGHVTMATVIASARFTRNSYLYFQKNKEDVKFKDEFMFVVIDPQNHPPKTLKQIEEFLKLTK